MPIVKHNRPHIYRAGNAFAFMPGVNQLTAEELAAVKAIPLAAARFESGILEEVNMPAPAASAEGDDKETGIKALSVKKAVDLVKETVDRALLDKMAAEDDRKGVQEAIKDQIEAITLTDADLKK